MNVHQHDVRGEPAQQATHRGSLPRLEEGCGRRGERATSLFGPTKDLSTGLYGDAEAMRGDDQGSGPPLDQRPHGLPYRGVQPLPPALDECNADQVHLCSKDDPVLSQAASPRPSTPVGVAAGVVQAALKLARLQDGVAAVRENVVRRIQEAGPSSALYFTERAVFHTARPINVPSLARPMSQPTRRGARVVVLPVAEETGTGLGYRRHVPLYTQLRVNDADGAALPSLVDTGASLSSIDAALLEKLGGRPQGAPIPVHGIGATESLGYATVTFFIDAHDPRGMPVQLEVTQDFHVLPSFAPGLCLGLDFITTHRIAVDPAKGKATAGPYTFHVRESMATPHATAAELCLDRAVTLSARSHQWVKVDTGALTSDVDYAVHPRLSVSEDESIRIAGPMALFNASTGHILLTNLSDGDVTLDRRTPVADAVAARLGDASLETAHAFSLHAGGPAPAHAFPQHSTTDGDPQTPSVPIDMFEDHLSLATELSRDAATTEVDGHWRVGLDRHGSAHPELVDLLRRHTDAFALDGRPGKVRGPEMEIRLTDDAALRPEAPRRASPEKRAAMDAAIEQLLAWDVIEPSDSPVSFPVLMVRQRDKWRFCVDYRQLNAATVADRYPLPTIDSVFQTLSGKRVFSSLDAIRGYHQMGVKAEDRWKTAFVCHRGLYQYRTVPFGLRNAPAVFQRLMDRILGDLRWQHAVVYIDDVVVATSTMDEHVQALDKLLGRASQMGLRFSPAKCTFGVPSLVLLGRKVSGAGLAVWKERATAVTSLRPPSSLRDLYHVLGLFGYYRPFIPNFAAVAEPLTSLTRGWRYEHADGRYRLINAEGKAVPAEKAPLEWSAACQSSFDALKTAIANPPVLAHPDPSRPYLLYVDASKQAFAAVLHQIFEDDVSPSALSQPVAAKLVAQSFHLLPTSIARDRWTAWLRLDRFFASIVDRLAHGDDGDADAWVLEDGVLVRRVDGRVALPEGALPILLREAHDNRGHFGFMKTFLALSQDFWRPGLSTAVRAWIKHCPTCQSVKLPRRVGALRLDEDPREPFESISIDLLLGMPRARGGVDAVLVILDVFSRMVLLHPCTSGITAEGIVAVISDRVLRLGWRPRRLISDSEARMTGDTMQHLARSLGATLTPSPPHHQQANPVERVIQTVQGVMRAMCRTSERAWDRRVVPAVELALNSSPSVTTGHRPFDLVFISHPRIVHAVFDASEHDGVGSFQERLAAAAERLNEARELVAAARAEQKRRYDARRRPPPSLRVGDRVFVRLTDRPVAGMITSKLSARKLGPYTVAEVVSPHRIRLALPAPLRINDLFSVEQLDALPSEDDPFVSVRVPPASSSDVDPEEDNGNGSPLSDGGSAADDDAPDDSPVSRPVRAVRPPVALRDYDAQLHTATVDTAILAQPIKRPRRVTIGHRDVLLIERPVAFLSRLTTVTEKKMVAAELELCCLAWAFGRLMHLLEGASVTVVTDHAPLGPMLTASARNEYGPTISKCRAVLMPHLPNLRFLHKPGRMHTNVDALSRLVADADAQDNDPGRSSSFGGACAG